MYKPVRLTLASGKDYLTFADKNTPKENTYTRYAVISPVYPPYVRGVAGDYRLFKSYSGAYKFAAKLNARGEL